MSKLPMREKISYVIANVGNIPVITLVSSYLSIFYVTVLGMDEFKVGTMFMIARIFDGINDPFIGYFMDKMPECKFGKFRKLLIMGTIICGLNYGLVWFGTAAAPEAFKLGVAYFSYLLLGITFPVMDISINSLLPRLTDDLAERNVLSSIKMVGYGIGGALCGIIAPMLISNLGSGKEAYLTVIGIFIVIIVACSVGGTLGFREHVQIRQGKQYQVKDLFRIITVSPVFITFLTAVIYTTGTSLTTTSNTYYAQYILGDLGKMTVASLINTLGMVPTIFIVPKLANKLGKKKVFAFGLILAGFGFAIKALCADATALGQIMFYLSNLVSGFGVAFSQILTYGIQADNIDYVEYTLNKRSEGAVSALSSMVTKIAMGLGGAIPMYILGATKTAAGTYSTAGLVAADAILPCIFCIVAGFIFLAKYPITKESLEKIHGELMERRSSEMK